MFSRTLREVSAKICCICDVAAAKCSWWLFCLHPTEAACRWRHLRSEISLSNDSKHTFNEGAVTACHSEDGYFNLRRCLSLIQVAGNAHWKVFILILIWYGRLCVCALQGLTSCSADTYEIINMDKKAKNPVWQKKNVLLRAGAWRDVYLLILWLLFYCFCAKKIIYYLKNK